MVFSGWSCFKTISRGRSGWNHRRCRVQYLWRGIAAFRASLLWLIVARSVRNCCIGQFRPRPTSSLCTPSLSTSPWTTTHNAATMLLARNVLSPVCYWICSSLYLDWAYEHQVLLTSKHNTRHNTDLDTKSQVRSFTKIQPNDGFTFLDASISWYL